MTKGEFEEIDKKLESMPDSEIKEMANILRLQYKYDFVLKIKGEFEEAVEETILDEREQKWLEWQRWIDEIRDRNRIGW